MVLRVVDKRLGEMGGTSGEDPRRRFASGLDDTDESVEERECDVRTALELTERGIVPPKTRDFDGVRGERDERGDSEDLEAGDGEPRPFESLIVGLIGETTLRAGGDVARVACDEDVA